ncbi:uncharacterized protein BKA55DRAFT_744312 [Fusarium redolens]|uniref:Uncharacterized protein n=1 Tax=Fusarium redolens TaxID=48865 RepID=A0A9P9FY41_FUSRE|nr:uncharacterized protein BKA55DRAFT_744312 [Fusarium redolens]KAH7210901.1 hypothetical protein BKA55DRAFT_744312 [Fusarium redolens]
MSQNQSSSNNTDFDMIAIADVAAQMALDVRGKFPQDTINSVIPLPRRLGRSQQPSAIDQEGMRLWNASQTKKDFDDFDPAVITEASENYKTVWRVCLRVFWSTPNEILSLREGLRYRPTPPASVKASHVVFSPKFSRLFAELVVHPCWEGRSNLFIMAIQYTVKVRVDSRTSWPNADILHFLSCPALKALSRWSFRLEEVAISLHEMHRQAREAQTEAPPSEFSNFLYFLGEIASMSPSSDYKQTYLGRPALPVTTKDLKILTTAVTHFDWEEVDWAETPEEVFDSFKVKGGFLAISTLRMTDN